MGSDPHYTNVPRGSGDYRYREDRGATATGLEGSGFIFAMSQGILSTEMVGRCRLVRDIIYIIIDQ